MDIYQIMARLDAISSKKTLTESQVMAEPVAEGQMKRHLENLAEKMSKADFVANAGEYGMSDEEAAEFWSAVNGEEEVDEAYEKLPADQLGLDKFSQAALSGGQRKRDALANPNHARMLAKKSAQQQPVKEVITTTVKKGDRVSVEGKPAVVVGQMKTPAGAAKYFAVRFDDRQYPGNTYDQVHANKLFSAEIAESKKSKPDFLDLDKDGDKKEPMKKAAADKNDAKGSFQKQMGGSARDLTKGLSVKSKSDKDLEESALQAYLGKKKYGPEGMKALQQAGRDGAGKEKMDKIRARHDKMDEADMEEGNKFAHNVLKAKAAGIKKADLDGDGDMETVREMFPGTPEYELRFGKDDASSAFDKKKISTGTVYSRKHQEEPEADDDAPRAAGRPKGAKRRLGAKGPSVDSKLLKGKGGLKEDDIDIVDRGEYDREGDMALNQMHQIADAVAELHSILDADDNLPEWVQSKITKALDYIDTARDYLSSRESHASEMIPEKAVSRAQQQAAGAALAAKRGGGKAIGASKEMAKMSTKELEKFASTKHKGLPKRAGKVEEESTDTRDDRAERAGKRVAKDIEYNEKKKDGIHGQRRGAEDSKAEKAGKKVAKDIEHDEKVDETTVAGSVATGGDAPKKSKGGMQFGKGVYEGQLDELDKSTLSSYVKKASKDVEDKATDKEWHRNMWAGDYPVRGAKKEVKQKQAAIDKRQAGIGKAVDRLTKEGVYEGAIAESFNKKLGSILNEGMNLTVSTDDQGQRNISVSATGADADSLGNMLKMAGLFSSEGYSQVCQHCGGIHEANACGAEQVDEELANAPDEQYSDTDTMINTLSGGLNGPKLQSNPNNMGDNPLAMSRLGHTSSPSLNLGDIAEGVEKESTTRLWDLYRDYKSK